MLKLIDDCDTGSHLRTTRSANGVTQQRKQRRGCVACGLVHRRIV